MRLFHGNAAIELDSDAAIEDAMRVRDCRGAAEFWIAKESSSYPCLAIRISHDLCDIHYFPREGHPGFRCLSREQAPGDSLFVWDGCDPAAGEEVPYTFVIPVEYAGFAVREFCRSTDLPVSLNWVEL